MLKIDAFLFHYFYSFVRRRIPVKSSYARRSYDYIGLAEFLEPFL